jgi:eukaryotic-like serine/threonine-protein kinase
VGADLPRGEGWALMSAAMEPAQLGRYVIQSELGRGAMGVVYKALDSVLERAVAVKTVNISLEREHADKYEKRFYQEAKAAGGLNHPNIVTIHDVGKHGEVVFMAMEYIEGVELRTLIGEGRPLRVSQALSIAAQVAEGLAYAHQRGVVHRDIKPANIMVVANGPVKITDFGIARMRGTGDLTQTGMLLGSPKYMSPEQVIGKRADHRSDIFSLGVILYEMLVGAAPFNGENVTALMYQIVNFVPPAPSSVNDAVPQFLDLIVAKMIAKPVEERYQDAAEVAHDLRECERQLAGATPVDPAAATRTLPLKPAGVAPLPPQPTLVAADAKTNVLAQSVARTREADRVSEEAPAPPAHGLATLFDSAEATQRLASLTGIAAPQSATQAIKSIPRLPAKRWRRRDWLVFAGAGLAGLIAARLIVRRGR